MHACICILFALIGPVALAQPSDPPPPEETETAGPVGTQPESANPIPESDKTDTLVFMVNAANPSTSLKRSRLKNLYMGNAPFWKGSVPVVAFVRGHESRVMKGFLSEVVGLSLPAFQRYWSTVELSGRAMAPAQVRSVDALLERVAQTPGGIGFAMRSEIEGSQRLDGVRIIEMP